MTMAMDKVTLPVSEEPTYLNLTHHVPGELDDLTGKFSKVSITGVHPSPEPSKRNLSLKKEKYKPEKPEEIKQGPAALVKVQDHAPGSPSRQYAQQQHYVNLTQQNDYINYSPGSKRQASSHTYTLNSENTPKAILTSTYHLDQYQRDMIMRNQPFIRTEAKPVENTDPTAANPHYLNMYNAGMQNREYYNITQPQGLVSNDRSKVPVAEPRLTDLGSDVENILHGLSTPRLDDPSIPATVTQFDSVNSQKSYEYVNPAQQRSRQSSCSSSVSQYKAASPISQSSGYPPSVSSQQPFSPTSVSQHGNYSSSPSPQPSNMPNTMGSPRQYPNMTSPGQYHNLTSSSQYPNTTSPSQYPSTTSPSQYPNMTSPAQYPNMTSPGQYQNITPSPPDYSNTSVSSPASYHQTVPSPSHQTPGNISPGELIGGMYDPSLPKMFEAPDANRYNSLDLDIMSLNNNPLPNMDDENINNPIYHNVPPQHPSQMMNQPPQSQPAMHAARQQQVYINGGNAGYYNDPGYLNQQQHMMGMPTTQPLYMANRQGPEYINMNAPTTVASVSHPHVSQPHSSAPVTSSVHSGKIAIPALPKPKPPAAQPVVYIILQNPQEKQAPAKPRAIAPRPAEGETKKDEKDDPKKKQGKKKGTRATKKNAAENSESKDVVAQKTPQQQRQQAIKLVQNTTDEKLLMINDCKETTLHTAIRKNQLHIVTALLEAMNRRPGLQPLINRVNAKDQTPLFMLVTSGYDKTGMITELLVKNLRADCNTLCKYENGAGQLERLSVLHYVSKYGDRCLRDLKTILQSRNVDVNLSSGEGVTALHLALWNHGQMDIKTRGKIDSAQVVDTLLQAGAACHTEDRRSGKTALHFAVETGSLELTRLIVEKCGVPETLIDSKNFDRRTPLHVAVLLNTLSEDNKIDLVRYLISKGASKTAKDKDRMTPSSLVQASQTKLLEVFEDGVSSPSAVIYSDDDSYGSPGAPGGLLSP